MTADPTTRAIFISYRRADAEGETGHLFEDLTRAFGDDSVFMDVAGIKPGADFRKVIEHNIEGCGVLLAVVGPEWATITDKAGARRIDNPGDSVRVEIAAAFARGVTIIPVMVRGAHMPHPDILPDDISQFSFCNSFEINHARWKTDVALLIDALQSYVCPPVPKTQLPPLPPPTPPPSPTRSFAGQTPPYAVPAKSSSKKIFGLAAGVIVAIGIGAIVLAGILVAALDYSNQTPSNPGYPNTANGANTANSSSAEAQPWGGPRVPPAIASMVGTWSNPTTMPGEDALTGVKIAQAPDGRLMVQAFGHCPTHLCDWGVQSATYNQTDAVTNVYHLANTPSEMQQERLATLTLRTLPDGLGVYLVNTWHDQSGQVFNNNRTYTFNRMASP
jgi:hypothetical protein